MLSGYRRARLPLNLNATSVKENTSFIIAKTSWHFQYHKAEICRRKLCVNCLRSSSHASNKCTSGQCKVCQARHNTLLHMPSAADPSTNTTDKEVAPKATPPLSVLANYASESFNISVNKSCFRLRLCSSATATARAGRVELCWIADRKRTS